MYTHILLATALTSNANTIAKQTYDLAKRLHAKLSIIHVVEHTPVIYGSGELSVPLDASLEEQLSEQAANMLADIAKESDIPEDQQIIAHGSVKQRVIETAEEIGADLIIVGSHGVHGVQLLLGSTANAILHTAKCDVLAIREA